MLISILRAAAAASALTVASELVLPPKGDATHQRALAAARRVGDVMGWEHFDCFIDRTGWTESRYNSRAGDWWREDTARGLLQLRPSTRNGLDLYWIPLWAPPELQVAMAANHVQRLVKRWGARGWLDVRAGWALPRLADKSADAEPRRAETEREWRRAAENVEPCEGVEIEVLAPSEWPGGAKVIAAAMGGGDG